MSDATAPRMLEQLEREAHERNLLLRLQVGRPLGLWSLQLVVAQPNAAGRLLLQGEIAVLLERIGADEADAPTGRPSLAAGVGQLKCSAVGAAPAIAQAHLQSDPLIRAFQGIGHRLARDLISDFSGGLIHDCLNGLRLNRLGRLRRRIRLNNLL